MLAVVLLTLALDVAGLVHPCPYCRTQRAALAGLRLLMIAGVHDRLLARYTALVVGAFGLIVGVSQNFNHIKKMNSGTFEWARLSIEHPWVLSGLAVLAMVWMLMLIFRLDAADVASIERAPTGAPQPST